MAEYRGRAKPSGRCRRIDGCGDLASCSTVSRNGASSSASQKRKRSFSSRCVSSKGTVKHVYDVISKFSAKKQALVKETGFGGILHFPPLGQSNRKFVLWIMTRVDPRTRTLVVDGSRKMKFDKEDVALVFGIPCGGKKVSRVTVNQVEVIGKVMDSYLGKEMKDHRSIKAAQEVIEREYDGDMTMDEQRAFKAAFVIYVVSTLLAPGPKYDQTSFDYWDALVDPDGIKLYDWSDYVIRRLIDGVVKVKSDLRGNSRVASITGCSLFLQILYLDSIDTGVLNMDHNSFPRVRHFDQSTMRSMILTDTVSEIEDFIEGAFGNSKFRSVGEVCYSWATQAQRHVDSQMSRTHRLMWDSASSYCQQLSVACEAAGPLFFALMDSYNHQKDGLAYSNLKAVSVVIYIASLFKHGFRYYVGGKDLASCIYDVCCHECTSVGDQLKLLPKDNGASPLCSCGHESATLFRFPLREAGNSTVILVGGRVARFVEESPLDLVKHCMTVRAMSRYYMSLRSLKDDGGSIDLNKNLIKFDDDSLFSSRRFSGSNTPVMTPWDLGLRVGAFLDHGPCEHTISRKLNCDRNGDMKCISHYLPKYIEVTLSSVKYCFEGRCEMEMDLFDAALRRFKEIDKLLYDQNVVARWRHFFESDFLGSILAGSFDINDHSIRAQLVGSHLEYDIARCRLLLFPGLVEQRWVCYAWCLDGNNVMVFDPMALQSNASDVHTMHKQVACAIKGVMDEVASKLVPSWNHDWKGASVSLARMYCDAYDCTNRTGLLCAQFCFSFDGNVDHSSGFIVPTRQAFASLMLEISKLSSNHGLIEEAIC